MEYLETFRKLGLTEYESRVMISLIILGPSSVREIVQQSKVPKNKAYETLAKLEQKNLVSTLPITPRKYKADNMSKLSEMIEKKENEVGELKKSIEQIRKNIASGNGSPYQEFFWVIKGQKAIQEKLRLENEKAKHEILSINRLSHLLPQNLRKMREGIQKGVKSKTICLLNKNNYEIVKVWKEIGVDIRIYNTKLFGKDIPRMTIMDNKSLRLTIGKPEVKNPEDYISLWTESPIFASMFKRYFNMIWDKSIPVEKELKRFEKKK